MTTTQALLEQTLHKIVQLFMAGRLHLAPRYERVFVGSRYRDAATRLHPFWRREQMLHIGGGDMVKRGALEDAAKHWEEHGSPLPGLEHREAE